MRPEYLALLYPSGTEARQGHKYKATELCNDGCGEQSGGTVEVREYLIYDVERPTQGVQSFVAIPIDVYRDEQKTDSAHEVHHSRQASQIVFFLHNGNIFFSKSREMTTTFEGNRGYGPAVPRYALAVHRWSIVCNIVFFYAENINFCTHSIFFFNYLNNYY